MKRLTRPVIALAVASLVASMTGEVRAQARGPAAATQRARTNAAGAANKAAAELAARVAALRGADLDAAVKAAEALGAAKDPAALEALVGVLILGHHPRVITAALVSLGAHADAGSYELVEIYLRHRDAAVRTAAVKTIGVFEDPRTSGHVLAALHDSARDVRAAAMGVIAAKDMRTAIEPMLELLKKGDEAAVPALATLANPDVARTLGELIGVAPDTLLARAFGLILGRADFGPETARVQVVRALGKVPGNDAVAELQRYVASIPETPPRQSRREAEALIQARSGGAPKPGGGQQQ